MLRQDNNKLNLMVIRIMSYLYASLLMVLYWHLAAQMDRYFYGIFRQNNNDQYWKIIFIVSIKYAFLLMVLHQYLVATISLSIYGMLRKDSCQRNLMVIVIKSDQYASLLMQRQFYSFMECYNRTITSQIRWSQRQCQIGKLLSWMVLHWHLEVRISLSVFGMLLQDNQKQSQMSIVKLLLQYASHPDGNLLASGSDDMSIRLWEAKYGYTIVTTNKNYQDSLEQKLENNSFTEKCNQVNTNLTILLISQQPVFQAR
ncbi:unnamed protein product (macronuclear) [Paramecium tetraurelia]|uniref:Uncharacterized protein n=1 Tax=Paramecium tetraurelia TaxID=5888 RepID=A0C0P0_PARTE|nr:uncharacterized protein GSPATT00006210001 [Paramecium tetraurelia]CAK64357.1 unnamed protein product [Paramecium tetraurelia]|eukprot:XP_001431755.1 hypothetical protein (macronuclear) [Paramecium tetraurelia strain d4-2]